MNDLPIIVVSQVPPDWLVANRSRRQPSILYEILENVQFIIESRKRPVREWYQVMIVVPYW
jgi:hypothetical protein